MEVTIAGERERLAGLSVQPVEVVSVRSRVQCRHSDVMRSCTKERCRLQKVVCVGDNRKNRQEVVKMFHSDNAGVIDRAGRTIVSESVKVKSRTTLVYR